MYIYILLDDVVVGLILIASFFLNTCLRLSRFLNIFLRIYKKYINGQQF